MRKLLLNVTLSALGALLVGSIAAWATNTTIGVTAGSGTLANLISFASTHVISEVGICDATTENSCGSIGTYGTAPGAVNALNVNANVTNSTTALPNNADGVAVQTGAANSPVNNYAYAFNGTSFDRERIDSGKNLQVVLGGGTPISASATGTTAATTATLSGTSGKTTYICGLSIRANATAAATGNATVTGTITGTLNFTQWTAPLASGVGVTEETFTPCLAASGTNQGISVVSSAPGSGGTVSSTAWGYQQ